MLFIRHQVSRGATIKFLIGALYLALTSCASSSPSAVEPAAPAQGTYPSSPEVVSAGEPNDGAAEPEPAPADATKSVDIGGPVAAISSSTAGACVLRKNGGTVWCWGENGTYQVMGADRRTWHLAVPRLVPDVIHAETIALGPTFGCARSPDGLRCWGNAPRALTPVNEDVSGQRLPHLVAQNVQGRLIAGRETLCALHESRVSCWSNSPSTFAVEEEGGPVQNLGPMVELTLGDLHACVRNDAGEVWCWGRNTVGAVTGRGGEEGDLTPRQVRLPAPAVQITASGEESCARLQNDQVHCWGRSYDGIVELRRLRGAVEIDMAHQADSRVCGIFEPEGQVRCLTRTPQRATYPCDSVETSFAPVPSLRGVEALAVEPGNVCALANGSVSCWGEPGFLGNGSAPGRLASRPVPLEGVNSAVELRIDQDETYVRVDAGPWLRFRGSRRGRAGHAVEGAAGFALPHYTWDAEGVVTCRTIECGGFGQEVTELRGATEIADLQDVSLAYALMPDGRVLRRRFGRWEPFEGLGPVAEMCRFCFRERSGRVVCGRGQAMVDEARSLGCGQNFSCAALPDGHVTCWGELSELSAPDERGGSDRPLPVPGIDDAVEVVGGGSHACALRQGGGVACWGTNDAGQLGDGSFTSRYEARPVADVDDAVEVVCGNSYTCLRHRSGAVSCFGNAFRDDPRPPTVEEPVPIQLP